nr:MAG TPA: hypothetical protein [Caudoviricetes sp.]
MIISALTSARKTAAITACRAIVSLPTFTGAST